MASAAPRRTVKLGPMLTGCPFPTHCFAVALTVFLVAACSGAGRGSPREGDARAAPGDDAAVVAALDEKYQDAVKRNDARAMETILAEDFVLVTGRGDTYDRDDLLRDAREATTTYERQDVQTRKVRVWGDTAVVTALLWIKGVSAGKPMDVKLWYSDTYVRTANGWRYVLGQASLPLPSAEPSAAVER